MNKDKKALLIGMCLGDGSIKKATYLKKDGSVTTYGVFSMTHTMAQRPYLEHKAKLLSKALKCGEINIGDYESNTAYGRIKSSKATKQHAYFRVLRKWLYPNDKKHISSFILNKLSPEAIAIWYMDDGGVSRREHKIGWGVEMRISTYFSEEEADCFIQYFKDRWGIQSKKRFSKKTGTYYMAFNMTESLKFEKLIQDYIVPCMEYKLPRYWNPRALGSADSTDDIV
jgi:recombination protein RecA